MRVGWGVGFGASAAGHAALNSAQTASRALSPDAQLSPNEALCYGAADEAAIWPGGLGEGPVGNTPQAHSTGAHVPASAPHSCQ